MDYKIAVGELGELASPGRGVLPQDGFIKTIPLGTRGETPLTSDTLPSVWVLDDLQVPEALRALEEILRLILVPFVAAFKSRVNEIIKFLVHTLLTTSTERTTVIASKPTVRCAILAYHDTGHTFVCDIV